MSKTKRRRRKQLKVKKATRKAKKSLGDAKSKKKQNVRVKTVEDRLFWKIVGIGMLALAAFSVAALASFDWECVAALTDTVKPQTNLVGVAGNTFAYGGYVAFGLAVWCIPFAFIIGGVKMLEPIPKDVEEIPNWRI